MNDQNFGERVNIPNITPMDGTIVAVDPTDGNIIDADATDETPIGETIYRETPLNMEAGSLEALFNFDESEQFRARWNEIQGRFVDEPRSAVQLADTLVSEVIKKVTQLFAEEHSALEGQWNMGTEVSTEELRKAMQHYRSFFNRLILKNEE